MPFDPTLPATNAPVLSAEMRDQFNGLRDLIDTIPIGPQGAQGPPGEVTNADLAAAIATTALNPGGGALEITVSNPPTTAEVVAVIDKLNQLISALSRP